MTNKLSYLLGGTGVLTLLWKSSSVARCWIKFSVFFVVCCCSCLPIPIWAFRPKDGRNALLPSSWFRACCRFWGLKYTIEGQENIVKNSGSVILINHQSVIDLIVLSHLWPLIPNCTVISKKEILYIQPFGLAFWLCGAIFIDRRKSEDAQSAVNRTGEIIRTRKSSVLMFPEGTRNTGNRLLSFKKGSFHLALASRCPIQPIAVSRYTFMGSNKFESGEVRIKILEPIPTEGLTKEDIPELIDRVYNSMSEAVDQLSDDSYNKSKL